MPTYEYECDACRHRFEQFQSITASALRKCPKCGKQKLRRLIGLGGAVIFKGGGFYETDYRSEGYRKAEEAERKSGESRPEAKADDAKPGSDAAKPKSDAAATKTEAAKPAAKDAASSETPSSAKPAPAAKPAGRSKSHAREGRGVGNLKRGAAKPAAKKTGRRGK